MVINVMMFGIAREIFGESPYKLNYNFSENLSVGTLRMILEDTKPELEKLGSYMIAVNNEYAPAEQLIKKNDEIAVIPPVSGG